MNTVRKPEAAEAMSALYQAYDLLLESANCTYSKELPKELQLLYKAMVVVKTKLIKEKLIADECINLNIALSDIEQLIGDLRWKLSVVGVKK